MGKNKDLHNIGKIVLGVAVIVIIAVIVSHIIKKSDDDKNKKLIPNHSKKTASSLAAAAAPSGSGFYKTVDQQFTGSMPNSKTGPNISPNEDMLDKIRQEKWFYREKISSRDAAQYKFPNSLGWWPRASYAGNYRLEPGQYPKYDEPPFSYRWRSDAKACGPENPCPFGGANNEGTPVNMYGKIVRRGMCNGSTGKCDCPMGMTNSNGGCVGVAARSATGDFIWSRSQWAYPISDLSSDVYTDRLEGDEIDGTQWAYGPNPGGNWGLQK